MDSPFQTAILEDLNKIQGQHNSRFFGRSLSVGIKIGNVDHKNLGLAYCSFRDITIPIEIIVNDPELELCRYLILHEMIHLLLNTHAVKEKDQHGRRFAIECNRVSEIAGWLKCSKSRPAAQWPFLHCRVPKIQEMFYKASQLVFDKVAEKKEKETERQLRVYGPELAEVIGELFSLGMDEQAEKVLKAVVIEKRKVLRDFQK